jgi:hypothetical protein
VKGEKIKSLPCCRYPRFLLIQIRDQAPKEETRGHP